MTGRLADWLARRSRPLGVGAELNIADQLDLIEPAILIPVSVLEQLDLLRRCVPDARRQLASARANGPRYGAQWKLANPALADLLDIAGEA